MKKILLTLTVVLTSAITSQVNAQKFAIKGGVNFSNMATRWDNDEAKLVNDDRKFLTGWNVGLATGIDFHKNFGFEAELIFNTKGLKYEKEVDLPLFGKLTGTAKRNLVYLDIPVSAKVMYHITDGIQLYGKFGPYIGIGLTGKDTVEVTDEDGKKVDAIGNILSSLNLEEGDVEWGEEGGLNRFDYGLQMGVGTEIGGFLVEGIYKFSLGDIDNSDLTKTKNHVFALSVGYNLDFRKFK